MSEPTASRRKAALVFIFLVVLIDVLAFGLIIPVLPHLVDQFTGSKAQAALWIGVFGTVFAAVQFICSPIQGALSDRYGRRPVILLSCLGLGLDFVIMALAPTLWWLLVARVFSGMFSASFTTANAYVADIIAPEQRAKSYGMIGAAFGVGFTIGPVLGGWLGEIDLRLPFWFAAGLALLNFCYGLFVLPESLPRESRATRFDWAATRPHAAIVLIARYPSIVGLAAVVFIANLAHYVYPSVFVLFADVRYGWGPWQVGWVLFLVGVCSVIVNVAVVGRAVKAFGERRALILGLGCGVAGFVVYAFAPQGWIFLLGLPVSALWAIAAPASQALITRQVDKDMQGRIQGALMSLVSVAGIIAPISFASVFGLFIGERAPVEFPGAPWMLAAVLLATAALIAWRYAPRAQANDALAEPG
ncbi:TCR/Tet family MFS transporter [Luteimonas viscosa]|uniref:TCR/Tet family MFS transporter n=1 Tax=Luteimonas viscosa TaxID=1132694 RepID=A0A5D4XRS5_9GAMM|nr:TCR/Tet family MFS transporter [Luteimonas viscosa]TYT26643.1 TCR/Tet family MFS transporter [Luteimonas viscosa]